MDPTFSSTPGSGVRASFGQRLVAGVIDIVIVSIVSGILYGVLKTYVFGQLIGIAYYTYMEGSSGQTVGKKLMNIKIQKQDGNAIDYVGAFIRYICKIISAIPCLLGYFWMLWDPNKEMWHDKLTQTEMVVVSS